jgi:hypothetical protein
VKGVFLTGGATAIAQYIGAAVVFGSSSFRSFREQPVLHYIPVSLVHQSYSLFMLWSVRCFMFASLASNYIHTPECTLRYGPALPNA